MDMNRSNGKDSAGALPLTTTLKPVLEAMTREAVRKTALAFLCAVLTSLPLLAQGPWGQVADKIALEFTGPVARGFALVAIVVGGLTIAFSEGGGKRTIGGIVFGLGMALGATQFVAWLFV